MSHHTESIKDPYEVLGVVRNAPDAVIRGAYRALAQSAHPDRGGDAKEFRRIGAAYEILKDPTSRAKVDRRLEHDSTSQSSPPRPPSSPPPESPKPSYSEWSTPLKSNGERPPLVWDPEFDHSVPPQSEDPDAPGYVSPTWCKRLWARGGEMPWPAAVRLHEEYLENLEQVDSTKPPTVPLFAPIGWARRLVGAAVGVALMLLGVWARTSGFTDRLFSTKVGQRYMLFWVYDGSRELGSTTLNIWLVIAAFLGMFATGFWVRAGRAGWPWWVRLLLAVVPLSVVIAGEFILWNFFGFAAVAGFVAVTTFFYYASVSIEG